MNAPHLWEVRIGGLCSYAALVQLFGNGSSVSAGQVHRPDALDV